MSAWPWASSDTTDKIIAALVEAMPTVEDVTRDRTAKIEGKDGKKGHEYRYADLAAVLDAIKPHLFAAGLAITQAASNEGVVTVLLHSSGEWLSYPALKVATGQNTPQAQGSALTYGRRYSLLAALNVATEDDDGKAAAAPAPKSIKTAARKQAEGLYDDLKALSIEARDAFRAFAGDRKFSVDALEADADWRAEVSNWLSEWEHNQQQAVAS